MIEVRYSSSRIVKCDGNCVTWFRQGDRSFYKRVLVVTVLLIVMSDHGWEAGSNWFVLCRRHATRDGVLDGVLC